MAEENKIEQHIDADEAFENNSSSYQGKPTPAPVEKPDAVKKPEEVTDPDEKYEERVGVGEKPKPEVVVAQTDEKKPEDGSKGLGFYERQIRERYANKSPETPEQKAERLKRERRNKAIAAVGDIISSLSNLYFTTKYSPNAYDPRTSLSASMQNRYDLLRKERQEHEREYNAAVLRAQQMDQQLQLEDKRQQNYIEKLRLQDEQFKKNMELKEKQQQAKEKHDAEELERRKKADEEKAKNYTERNQIFNRKINSTSSKRGSGIKDYILIREKVNGRWVYTKHYTDTSKNVEEKGKTDENTPPSRRAGAKAEEDNTTISLRKK